MEQTAKCKFCGNLYVTYSHTVQDQTACPKCVHSAHNNMSDQASKFTDNTLNQFKGLK